VALLTGASGLGSIVHPPNRHATQCGRAPQEGPRIAPGPRAFPLREVSLVVHSTHAAAALHRGADSFLGASATIASVVMSRPATDDAARDQFAGASLPNRNKGRHRSPRGCTVTPFRFVMANLGPVDSEKAERRPRS
jgi:hypothetical protein